MRKYVRGVGKLLRDYKLIAIARYELVIAPEAQASPFVDGYIWIGIGTPPLVTGFVPLHLELDDGRQSFSVVLQEPAFEISHIRYTVYPAVDSVVPPPAD